MARGAYSEDWIKRRIAEGRGQGEGRHYKPWIQIGRQEFSSRGRSHLCPGTKCNRDHHVLSDLEKAVWLILEWSIVVVDIREQFPLFPRKICWQLARELGISHPYDTASGTPRILTTDFLCSLADSGQSLLALSAKYESDLEGADAGTLARLELERRFWEHFGVPWRLVTDKDVPHPMVENLEWLVDCQILPKKLHKLIDLFRERLTCIGTVRDTLQSVANQASVGLDLKASESLSILCHLIWQREITVDLDEKLSPSIVQTIVFGITQDVPSERLAL